MILDLMNPAISDIKYVESTFPDGQPHIKVDVPSDCTGVDIVCTLATPLDFFRLMLARDAVLQTAPCRISAAYVMGARMDRSIGHGQPSTFDVVSDVIGLTRGKGGDFAALDIHSDICMETTMFRGGSSITNMHPRTLYEFASAAMPDGFVIVAPDKGSIDRAMHASISAKKAIALMVKCEKTRDPNTGALSGFHIVSGDVAGKHCLIVDDICDGGGTFTGIAKVLREAGALSVRLCVTHGILSKGLPLEGVDEIFTTDSFESTPLNLIKGGLEYAKRYDGRDVYDMPGGRVTVLTDYLHKEVKRRNEEA